MKRRRNGNSIGFPERKESKMKKIYLIAMIAILMVASTAVKAVETQGRLDIDVWLDNDDGIYYEGENVTIFFRISQDAFVAIYSLDTRGQVSMLFPAGPWDDGFVHAGDVYAIPNQGDDYELYVSGPEGVEFVQAIASPTRMNLPDWFNDGFDCNYYEDREDCLKYINDRYFGANWDNGGQALDRTTIYVKSPHYYYRPVYTPRSWYDYPQYSMIYIDYPFGAEVYIDGIYFGIAPLWIPRVVIGWHWFTIYDRYGYCWEDHIQVYHNHPIRFDHSRVKTGRTVVSRFKDVRMQAKKYGRTDYVLSDQRVKTTLVDGASGLTKKYPGGAIRSKPGQSTRTTTGSKRDGYTTTRSTTRERTSGTVENRTTTRKSTGSAVERKSTQGSTERKATTTKRSSGTPKLPAIKKSPDGKSSPSRKEPSSIGKDGGGSRSSGARKSSTIGRSSSGRSAPSRSAVGRSSTGRSSSGRVSSGRSSSGRSSSGKSSSKGSTSRSGGTKR